MSTSPPPGRDEVVDVTVESPAARAREAHSGPTAPAPRETHARAWMVAVAADLIQIAFAPLFGPGFLAPWNDVLDIVVAAVLVRWLGFHWALLPTLIAELVPGLGLVPTWTAAVWIATRQRRPPQP